MAYARGAVTSATQPSPTSTPSLAYTNNLRSYLLAERDFLIAPAPLRHRVAIGLRPLTRAGVVDNLRSTAIAVGYIKRPGLQSRLGHRPTSDSATIPCRCNS